MDAAERLRTALAGKTRGYSAMTASTEKGPIEAKPLVTVTAADVAEVASAMADDPIAAALRKGCLAGRPDRQVSVYADDLFHLLEGPARGKRKGGD